MPKQDLTDTKYLDSSSHRRSNTIKILVADDHPLMRLALRETIEKEKGFEIVAEACDGLEAVKLTDQFIPDILIMDINMPNLNGLEATKQIKAKYPDIGILILTGYSSNEHILGVLQAGADGFLLKDTGCSELVHTVYTLAAGETVISPAISKKIFAYAIHNITKPENIQIAERLSARELQVLKLLAKGLSNKEISNSLCLGQRTIKSHLTDIFSKLKVTSRTEAVVISLRKGILNIDDIK